MKRHLGLGIVGALVVVGPSMAADSDTINVTTSVQASCTLTTLLDPVETLSAPYPGVHNIGNLGYTCNFGNGLQYPSLKIQSAGGTALVNSAYGHSVQYRVKWNVPMLPAADFETSAPPVDLMFQTPGNQGPTAFVEQSGAVLIDLLGDLTYAGTYSDTITFAISP